MKHLLKPGIGLKRWMFSIGLGLVILTAFLLVSVSEAFNKTAAEFLGQNLKIVMIISFAVGIILMFGGSLGLGALIVRELMPEKRGRILRLLEAQSLLKNAPRVVVIGGGTGLYTLLKGMKKYTRNITAIVSVSDAGGSSGKLRTEFGMLPPGDIRMCLVALSDHSPLMAKLLQYRFKEGEGLKGHSFGNLLITALSKITGSFDKAVFETGDILAIRGKVLPVTLKQTTLCAELNNGKILEGEPNIESSKNKYKSEIKKIFLKPRNTVASDEALKAIKKADIIVLGPGSLYTSIVPNLLVKGVPDAIKKSKAKKAYIANVMTQPGETDNYTASDHVEKIVKYVGKDVLDYVVVNDKKAPENLYRKYREKGSTRVKLDDSELEKFNVKVVKASLMTKENLLRHDSVKLAKTILRL